MRYLPLILFAMVLAVPFVMRRAILGSRPRGDSSGAERLVVITPHNQDVRNAFAQAFGDWHRTHYGSEVKLEYLVPGGTSDIKRQLETTYRAFRDPKTGRLPAEVPAEISVAWGGGDYFFDQEVKPLGILQPIQMPPALLREFHAAFPEPTLAGVKLYDSTRNANGASTPQWIGICLSSFGICYNPDVYRALQLPDPSPEHGWQDLTEPRLAGFVSLADPAHSGSSAVAYQMVIQHKMAEAESAFFRSHPDLKARSQAEWARDAGYRTAIAAGWKQGMEELLKIAANARTFVDSSTLVPMDVARGEAAAAMVIDVNARVTQESAGADRIRYFAPIGATAITPDPVAILYGVKGRKLELADHFVEFLLSPEGQLLWILKAHVPGGPMDRSLRRMPIRRDLYADRANWADDANPFQSAGNFNQRGAWMALFGDTRPIWVAAWIDSRDALHDAYRKILAVPDPSRRQSLIDALADLPIEMSDVEAIRSQRKKLEQSQGDIDPWRAAQQIDWAERFRNHYRKIGAEAQ